MSENQADRQAWQLLTVIVNAGQGSKALRQGRLAGITGGTILLGRGTAGKHSMFWSDENEIRREIVLMIADEQRIEQAVVNLQRTMKLGKPFHGIAFSIRICGLLGSSVCQTNLTLEMEDEELNTQKAVFAIVDKGMAETIVDAAENAGAHGATIINARGAGIHETSRLFSMAVEPEREIVLIIDDSSRMPAIIEAVRQAADLDQPGHGILFAVDVNLAVGLYKG
jgi:nitrogen regulatory protein PII